MNPHPPAAATLRGTTSSSAYRWSPPTTSEKFLSSGSRRGRCPRAESPPGCRAEPSHSTPGRGDGQGVLVADLAPSRLEGQAAYRVRPVCGGRGVGCLQ